MSLIFPALCPACKSELSEVGGLCPACWREVEFIAGPACPSCGVPAPTSDAVCDACAHAPPAWSRGRAAVVYDGAGRRLILALKHGDRLDIAPLAASWMLRAGRDLVEGADLIAPAPLHWTRLIRRRFNQSGELARELAREGGRVAALDLLRRHRRTPSQDGKSRLERHKNVADAFSVAPNQAERVEGANILLVDDVITTGATLSACAEVLRAAGARDVNVLAMARVAREAHWD